MTTFTSLQLWQHGISHVYIVTVPCAVSDTKGMHVGVFAKILQFGLLVVGVYGDQHSSDFRRSIKECQPIGYIGSPYADVRARLHTDGNQSFGQVVYTFVKLRPSESKIAVGIYDVFFVGGSLCPVFEPLSQRALPKFIAGASSFSRVCSVWQRSACHV